MKHLVISIGLLLLASTCFAEYVSESQALDYAIDFHISHFIIDSCQINSLRKDIQAASSIKRYGQCHLIQFGSGWALVSTESTVKPILAYSESGTFLYDSSDTPDGIRELFAFYDTIIIRTKDNPDVHPEWKIKPLNKNKNRNSVILSRMQEIGWAQSRNNGYSYLCSQVYNKRCPTFADYSCLHNAVGCGAVAIGQVMWYFKWPYAAVVPRTMTDSLGNPDGKLLQIYDWDLMPSKIYNNTPINEVDTVASFLRDCGFAINTQYRYDGSTSYFDELSTALTSTFSYRCTTNSYGVGQDSLLQQHLKEDINNGRPVILRGANADNLQGHFFIVFGYNDYDLFNINWGWGDSYNHALFAITNLSILSYDYNYFKYAIRQIRPFPVCRSMSNCSTYTYESDFKFIRYGPVIICNKTINEGVRGLLGSSISVEIGENFTLPLGAELTIDIIEQSCDE